MLTTTLSVSLLSSTSVMKLYDQLHDLPLPLFVGQRLKLPCLRFKLGAVTGARNAGGHVFHAQTDTLGTVELRTEEDLSRFSPLYLVHPWIDFLLDRQPVGSIIKTTPEENTEDQSSSIGKPPPSSSSLPGPLNITSAPHKTGTGLFASRLGLLFGGLTAGHRKDAGSLPPPSSVSQEDKLIRAFQMTVRLKQPFGALLLTENPGNVTAYRRVATETLITVKLKEITPTVLKKLISSVSILDVH